MIEFEDLDQPVKKRRKNALVYEIQPNNMEGKTILLGLKDLNSDDEEKQLRHQFLKELIEQAIEVNNGSENASFVMIEPGTRVSSLATQFSFRTAEDEEEDPDKELDLTFPRYFAASCDWGLFLNYKRFTEDPQDYGLLKDYASSRFGSYYQEDFGDRKDEHGFFLRHKVFFEEDQVDEKADEVLGEMLKSGEVLGPEAYNEEQLEEIRKRVYKIALRRLRENNMKSTAPQFFYCIDGTIRKDRPVWAIDLEVLPIWEKRTEYGVFKENFFNIVRKYVTGIDAFVSWDYIEKKAFDGQMFSSHIGHVGEVLLMNPKKACEELNVRRITQKEIQDKGRELNDYYQLDVALDENEVDPIPTVLEFE